MKKILLITLLFLSMGFKGFAQCTPDSAIGNGLMYPSELAEAMAGYYYSQVLTFRVPSDTEVVYNGNNVKARIDSMRVVAMSGVPRGYSFACSNPSCVWKGGTLGCALIQGIVEKDDTLSGTETRIKMYIYTWATVANTFAYNRLDSSENYVFKIRAYNGMPEITTWQPLTCYPNPTDAMVKVELRGLDVSDHNRLLVFDATGKVVFEKTYTKQAQFLTGENIDLGACGKGIYFVTLQSGEKNMRQVISVQ